MQMAIESQIGYAQTHRLRGDWKRCDIFIVAFSSDLDKRDPKVTKPPHVMPSSATGLQLWVWRGAKNTQGK